MSQSRFWVSTHYTYEEAAKAKDRAQNDSPDGVFQIRKGTDKGVRQVFRVVQRFKNNEAKVVTESKNRGKKRARRSKEDFSWLTGKS